LALDAPIWDADGMVWSGLAWPDLVWSRDRMELENVNSSNKKCFKCFRHLAHRANTGTNLDQAEPTILIIQYI